MHYALVLAGMVKAVILADSAFISAKGAELAQVYGYPSGAWVETAGAVGRGWTYEGGQFARNIQGQSVSGATPAAAVSAGATLQINLNGDGVRTIMLGAGSTAAGVAADVQGKMRALTPNNGAHAAAYSGFVCAYNSILRKYYLVVPTWEGGTVVVSGGTAAASLKLGTANGGAEVTGNGESGD